MKESAEWLETLPVIEQFSQVADSANYAAVPDDWLIGISDVVGSASEIRAGRYKAVNLAGAATISAVSNALAGALRLFVFGGDGAHFVVSPEHHGIAKNALARVAIWAERDLHLHLRVGMVRVSDARAAGFDTRVALWQASENVRYAMFTGGGLGWAEAQLKSGVIGLKSASTLEEPDLSGLSCQWGPVRSLNGSIVSLIVKPVGRDVSSGFVQAVTDVITTLDQASPLNPMPLNGPDVRWPAASLELQARVSRKNQSVWWRRWQVTVSAILIWLIFRLNIPVGRFDPARYRREIHENSDFQKFDEGLMMTVDCSAETISRLRSVLQSAADEGVIRYGIHLQDEALVTCVVPSVLTSDHMHFIDGADGGYVAAAQQLRTSPT